MNKVEKEEMFGHVRAFLKSKGIELQEGSYAQRIRQGCGILTDTINLSQEALGKTKAAVGKGLDQVRQVIHEKTAPKPPAAKGQHGNPPARGASPEDKSAPKKSPPAKLRNPKSKRRAPRKQP